MYVACLGTRYPGPMAVRGTPQRVIRIDDETWEAYGELCAERGTSRSDDVRRYVHAQVKAWRAEQRRAGTGQKAP